MNILGLHFGHDASVTVCSDGRIVSHVLVERHLRVKQAVGVRTADLETALRDAGISWDDVDVCTIVSTQDLEVLVGLIDEFRIEPGATPAHPAPSPYADLLQQSGIALPQLLAHGLQSALRLDGQAAERAGQSRWKLLLPEWEALREGSLDSFGWINKFTTHERWQARRGLAQIAAEPSGPGLLSDAVRFGMHYPATVYFGGIGKPAYFIDHHVCHAASTYYRSGFDRSAILTQDGGDATRGISGLFAYGEEERLYVLCPHHLALGGVFRATGVRLGLGLIGAEGKLMGLASYGSPRFFDRRFVGNHFDVERRFRKGPFQAWFAHCLDEARSRGYRLDYGSSDTILDPLSKDIAASTQKLFEEGYLDAVECLYRVLSGADRRTSNLCLSGGSALNCPSNSRLYNESPFGSLYIEPNCDDGGLSVGAALFCHHNLLGRKLDPAVVNDNKRAYLGVRVGAAVVEEALESVRDRFEITVPAEPHISAATDLAEDRLLAWFEGRSEMGPRALCHRSLLASPLREENWARVNSVKGREAWRPLAPVVTESAAADWFSDCPSQSPYMLFTGRVRSRRIPAVTHVDGSARLQTVNRDAGAIAGVLEHLEQLTGCAVALNTSLNRPGEPIVETPADALELFSATDLDVLYLEGRRVVKRG